MITIPDAFAASIVSREGDAGRRWIAAIPQLLADLCQRWGLAIDGPPWHGHLALVVPVRRRGEPCVLKISWQDADTIHEARALDVWNGRGTVRMLESDTDHGAMLLERLDAQRTLLELPLDRAIPIAGAMIRTLAVPGPATVPTVADLAAEIARSVPDRWQRLGHPIDRLLIDQAVAIATGLSRASAPTMVNWDLHYGNVLYSASRQDWVAIDPKPAVGALESGITQLLWTRISDVGSPADFHRHLRALIAAAALDADRTRDWIVVRAVDFWLWELSVGLTHDPGGCATILRWLGHR